jgi:hypothetical protein
MNTALFLLLQIARESVCVTEKAHIRVSRRMPIQHVHLTTLLSLT